MNDEIKSVDPSTCRMDIKISKEQAEQFKKLTKNPDGKFRVWATASATEDPENPLSYSLNILNVEDMEKQQKEIDDQDNG